MLSGPNHDERMVNASSSFAIAVDTDLLNLFVELEKLADCDGDRYSLVIDLIGSSHITVNVVETVVHRLNVFQAQHLTDLIRVPSSQEPVIGCHFVDEEKRRV